MGKQEILRLCEHKFNEATAGDGQEVKTAEREAEDFVKKILKEIPETLDIKTSAGVVKIILHNRWEVENRIRETPAYEKLKKNIETLKERREGKKGILRKELTKLMEEIILKGLSDDLTKTISAFLNACEKFS